MLIYNTTVNRPQPHRYVYYGAPDNLAQRSDASLEREMVGSVGFSGRGSLGVLRRKGEKNSEFTPNCKRLIDASHIEYEFAEFDGSRGVARISLAEAPPPSYLVKSFNPSQRLEYLEGLRLRAQFDRSLKRSEADNVVRRVASGLTARGKIVIADGISLLVRKYGQRALGFYTLTCPYSGSADIQIFNDNFPEIIRQYMQFCKRVHERAGSVFSYVGVYEVQPKRFSATGDAALHFHFVARSTDSSGGFFLSHSVLCSRFREICERVTGIVCNRTPRVDAQLVKFNAAAYLAKYFSKGGLSDSESARCGAVARLSSWYSVSRNLLVAVRKSRTELPGHILADLYAASATGGRSRYAVYLRAVYVEFEGRRFHCGAIFTLAPEFLDVIRELKYLDVCHLY